MVRKLKFHEQKLLKRLDLVSWEAAGGGTAELRVLRRYRLPRREDYTRYNQLSRAVRALARRLRDLGSAPAHAAFRARCTAALLGKLQALGLVSSARSLEQCDRVTASSFCRRRLPCVLLRLRMAPNLRAAVTFVEQGHVRVGPTPVTDPAFLVPRALEDFITWAPGSRLRHHLLDYNQERDDWAPAAAGQHLKRPPLPCFRPRQPSLENLSKRRLDF
ncbi:PREDICTED: U3 small nucleolar ribonucleoprotein protein IMP3 [Crocodylus porosus]|uniref:U3 small nucleolar ribonucleoprotein protein IMP3 n=1 Tax=Crocodylus porosus TaxID=8502 RepID=UPI00093E0D9E|nr:PREDICTED: U3 small nucleolar ribonucleoprotein protein IMP3 [Crocodylus porosus]